MQSYSDGHYFPFEANQSLIYFSIKLVCFMGRLFVFFFVLFSRRFCLLHGKNWFFFFLFVNPFLFRFLLFKNQKKKHIQLFFLWGCIWTYAKKNLNPRRMWKKKKEEKILNKFFTALFFIAFQLITLIFYSQQNTFHDIADNVKAPVFKMCIKKKLERNFSPYSLAFFSSPSYILHFFLSFVLLFCKFHFTHKIKMVEWTGFSSHKIMQRGA